MNRTYVMTVRLPRELGHGLERYAARTGHKPAHLGALAMDEFMRRRSFPLIDFRETAVGRVAYVKGTRLAVYWLVNALKRMKGNIAQAAQLWSIAPEKVRTALHYAEKYPEEIKAMEEQADENRDALQKAEAALARLKHSAKSNGRTKAGAPLGR